MTTISTSTTERFVRCIAEIGDPLSITPGQYYQVIPDPAEVDGMIRIIDNTGEDYLYDADLFEESTDLDSLHAELSIALTESMAGTFSNIIELASDRKINRVMHQKILSMIEKAVEQSINGSN